MSTNQRSSVSGPSGEVGFLERKPRLGTTLTVLLLVLIGVGAGTAVGLLLKGLAESVIGTIMGSL